MMAQPDVGPNDIVIHLLNPYKCAVCATEFFMRSVFLEHLGEHIEKLKAGNPCNQVVCAVSLAEVPDSGITVTRDILQINDQQMFELQDPTLDYTQLTPLKTLEDAGILSLPKPQLPKIWTKSKQEALVKLSQETNVTNETNKFSLLAKHPQLRIESQLGEDVLNSSVVQMDLNDHISQQSFMNLQNGPHETNLNIAELDAIVQQTLFEDGKVRGEYSIKIETPSQLTQAQESMMVDDASQGAEGVETVPNHLLHAGFGNVEEKSILGKKKKKPVCPICLNEFSNQNALERHQVVHTGEKPHRCLVCFKQFNDISSLRKHNFIHKRQHRCPICHRLYLRRSQLVLHMKHHGKKRYIQFGNAFHEVKVEMSRNEHGQMVQEFSLMMLLPDKDKNIDVSHVQEDQIGGEAYEKINQTSGTLVNEDKSVLLTAAQRDGTEEAGSAESLRKKSVIYRCGHCKKMIFTRPTLSRHLIRHTDKRPFTCEECSKSFRDKLDLVRHHMTHTKPVKCDTCSSCFSKPLYLEKHLLQGCPFKDNDDRFTVMPNLRCRCNVCHKILKSKVNVLRHLRVHAFDDRVKEMASKTVNTEEEGAKSSTVDDRGKGNLSLRRVSGLSQNVDNHYKSLENSVGFSCLICGQEFRFRSFMKTHILVHLDLRPFKCDECGKTFFARHMLKKHQQNHTRPYKCPVCDRGFIRRYLMRDHFNKKHEAGKEDKMQDITILEDSKLIQCDICGKTMQSYQKSLMLYHVRLHKDVRPFECQTCQKKFSSENALKKHSLNHKKPYICKVCNHGFSRRYLLMEHFKKSCSKKKITKFATDNILEFPKEAPVARLNLGERFDQDSGPDISETDKPFDEAATYHYQPTVIKEISTETGSEKYICEPCDKPFVVYETLIRHLTTFAKSTACKHCQTVFPDKHLTMAHQRSCLGIPIESQIKSRKLLPLGKKQVKVQKIMKEIKEVIENITSKAEDHKALPIEVMNTESDISTATVSAAAGHQVPSGSSAQNTILARTITALAEQKGKFPCPECAKTFGTPRGLKIHANSHIRLYKCESCGEDFTQLSQLRAHCVRHQEGSIDPKSLVREEDKRCAEELNVQGESVAWDSFDTNSSSSIKECMPEDNTNECEEKFSDVKLEHKTIEEVNQRLMMAGTRGRPFSCKLCRRRFTEQCSLDTHILQIHGV